MQPILDSDKAKVYYDGIFSNPRLQHPEGVALDNEGYVYCGTENGEIMKIDKDKSKMECLANSGGFILGIAIDEKKNVFACEMKEAALYKYDSVSKKFTEFARGPKIPNYPVIDSKRNCIYVSDSFGFNEKGIGLYKFDWTCCGTLGISGSCGATGRGSGRGTGGHGCSQACQRARRRGAWVCPGPAPVPASVRVPRSGIPGPHWAIGSLWATFRARPPVPQVN